MKMKKIFAISMSLFPIVAQMYAKSYLSNGNT